MNEYIFDVVNQTSKLDWAFAFQRTGAFPIDRSSLFSSLADAEAYARGDKSDARGLGGSSYVGQPVSVYDEENNTVSLYVIDADRTLKEVGSGAAASVAADDASIVVVDGKVQLKDFGSHYYAFVPAQCDEETGEIITPATYELTEGFKENLEPRVRFEDDKYFIAWYEPSGEIAEDIAVVVDTLKDNIVSLETATDVIKEQIGTPAEGEVAATGLYAQLDEKVNKVEVYTKTEVESLIAQADHLKRTTVAGVESINPEAKDAEQFIYMVPNAETGNYDEYMVIDGEIEKVGDWKVDLSDYATLDELDTKVDKVDNARLMTNAEAEKLAALPSTAEENFIKDVNDEFAVVNGKLELIAISQSKVSGLTNALTSIEDILNSKVTAQANARLITNDEAAKLAAIKDLIQAVNPNHFSIDESGQLLLNKIQINQIEELSDKLAGKVDKVEGSRLITEAEAGKLEKLSIDKDGNVGLSGTVSASNVQELYDNVVNIVSGNGNGIYDDVSRPLLGIEAGAEKNIINSVNNSQLAIDENRELSIKAINITNVTGLEDMLNAKATNAYVDSVVDLLNSKSVAYDNRLAALEGHLTWQSID